MQTMRVLLCIYPQFAELQVAPALDLLRGHADLTVAAATRDPVPSEGGLSVLPNAAWPELRGARFDALVLPGAVDLKQAWEDTTLHDALRDLAPRTRVIAAICGGPMVLHAAGLLRGRRYTTNFTAEQREFLGVSGAEFVDDDVVIDRDLITARGHAHGRFGLALAEALGIGTARLRRYVLGATTA